MAVVSVHLCWPHYGIYYQLSVSVEMGTVGWKWEMGLSICAMGSVDSIASTEWYGMVGDDDQVIYVVTKDNTTMVSVLMWSRS